MRSYHSGIAAAMLWQLTQWSVASMSGSGLLAGVYTADEFRRIRFYRLPPPDDAEVARVTARIARRIVRLLERRGLGLHGDPEEADPLQREQPLLAELYAASVHGRIADGPRAGHRVLTKLKWFARELLIPWNSYMRNGA